jgi:hypothetical protein
MGIIDMKRIFYQFFALCVANSQPLPTPIPEEKKIVAEQAHLWRENLARARQMEPMKKFEFLSLGLRNMGHRKSYEGNDIWVDDVYRGIQQEYFKEENFIQFFTQKIETERVKVADHPFHSGTRGQFNRLRGTIIEDTLCHLPSPETVAALGNYLFDERDTPPPMFPGQDWIDVESNAYLACKALGKIGLRHSPGPPPAYEQEENLAAWRLWWKDVEAGRCAISFEGEKVEYWLREKGTWETAAWKNEHRTREASSADMQDEHKRTSHSLRWLLVLGGALLGILWLRWKKQRAASS